MALQFQSGVIVFVFATLACASPCLGQASQRTPASDTQSSDTQLPGSINGTVVDGSGAVVGGARVTLTRGDQTPSRDAISGSDGQFSFSNLPPGPFVLVTASPGFASKTSSGILHPGENHIVPQIALEVATASTEVQVRLSAPEVAEAQVKDEEKQRVMGFIPNFYVSYDPHPVPLNSKQKFELAWRMTVDPINLIIIGGIAGVEQSQNDLSGYGQGAQGYAKRYGANFADSATATFIGSAILPSLLKQDPRYFYKGSGSARARAFYAIANTVICKGDNGHWQPNYSNVFGNLAAGGISNLYYPARDRNGVGLTFENSLIGLGAGSAANLFQEFLVRKLTPRIPHPAKP